MTTTDTTARIAVVVDQDVDWAEDLIKYTVRRITDPTDPFPNDDLISIFSDGTATIDLKFEYASCEPNNSPRAYWRILQQWNNINGTSTSTSTTCTAVAPHCLIGARCSSASKELAVLSSVQQVPQVSPASSSAELSDKKQYPYFSRLIGPDSAQGQAGALVALLRSFQWSHVGVVITDEQYSRDLANEFQDLWRKQKLEGDTTTAGGSIAYTYSIRLNKDKVDPTSVQTFLSDSAVTDRKSNSRVIVLIARERHALAIVQQARLNGDDAGFPPEPIWIGTDAWVGRVPKEFQSNFEQESDRQFEPGYIGLTPYQNRLAPDYVSFFDRINEMAVAEKNVSLFQLGKAPDYSAATLVDSIVALTMTLSRIPPNEWNNGSKVTEMLRSLSFSGVSGSVAFTQNGNLLNPSFGILNTVRDGTTRSVNWIEVGTVTSGTVGDQCFTDNLTNVATCWSTNFTNDTCYDAKCQLTSAPDDTYYVFPLPIWAVVVIIVAALGFAALLIRYCRSSFRIRAYTAMIHTATEELNRLIQDRFQSPEHWDEGRDGLVEVLPTKDEYWKVRGLLRERMSDAHISHLWRVQNHSLWAYYSSHKDRWTLLGTDHNEMPVWHGTSNVDPDVICSDPQDGFIMQLAKYGWWGRGLYFAASSLYSHSYAYRPYGSVWQATYGDGQEGERLEGGDKNGNIAARHEGEVGEREMFLVKLLVGDVIDMPRDANLSIPPHKQGTSGPRYNTVTGKADDGTQVYVVYENGRAYPEYLVRYYRGCRDDVRTPYETQTEAKVAMGEAEATVVLGGTEVKAALGEVTKAVDRSASVTSDGSRAGDAPTDVDPGSADDAVSWEFEDNHGWNRYSDEHQALLEGAHQQGDPTVLLVTDLWDYEVDLKAGIQTNLSHHSHTQRRVRRVVNVVDV